MIRRLLITDYQNLSNLLKQLTECPDLDKQIFEQQFEKLNKNDFHIVMEKEGKLVAYGCIIIDHKFYRNCKNVGHIEDIVVDKEERCKGFAGMIINSLIEYGKKNNCYKFVLTCSDEYIDFYRKYGFDNKNNNMIRYIN